MSLSDLLLLLLLTFSLFTSAANSNSYDRNSTALICPPHECGNITIEYPFWLQGDATSDRYCGYRGFGLTCTPQNQTILSLPNEDYYVRSLNYSNCALTLVDTDLNQTCPRARHNLTIEHLPLNYSSLDLNLSFYLNCSSHPSGGTPIECLRSGVNMSYVYAVGSEPDNYDWYEYCEQKVVATVIGVGENMNNLISWFSDAMVDGFTLNWHQMDDCGECEASDGGCGYDQRTQNFLCFCSDGTIKNKNCKGMFSFYLLFKFKLLEF